MTMNRDTMHEMLAAADELAQALSWDKLDPKPILRPLASLMPAIPFVHVCNQMDLCPTHYELNRLCFEARRDCPAGKPRVEAKPF